MGGGTWFLASAGKWDMTNDKESSVQKVIEIKEDNVFVETWTVYDDDGNQHGEVEIQGKCEFPSVEGIGDNHALSLVYDLATLSDSDGILETKNMNLQKGRDKYMDSKMPILVVQHYILKEGNEN